MISIEFKRVLKESVILFLVLVGLLIAILITDKDTLLAPVLEIFLLLYASFTGWSMFDKERNEGTMEYLLSLPVSRTRLFFIKFLPRALFVCLTLFIYLFLHNQCKFPSLLLTFNFSIIYIAFFFISLSLSLSLKSFIGAFLLTSIISGGLTLINMLLDLGKSGSSVYLQANVPLVIFPVLFFAAFHFFDLKPAMSFNLKFSLPALGALLLIIGITYFITDVWWNGFFLTKKGDIFKASHRQSQLIKGKESVHMRFDGYQFPLLEKETFLFAREIKRKRHGFSTALNKLNLETGEKEMLIEFPQDWYLIIDSYERTGIVQGENFYFILGNFTEKKFKILEIAEGNINETPIKYNFNKKTKESLYNISLVYVSPDHLYFIITSDEKLYRVYKTGAVDELFNAERLMVWKNRVLVFNETGMTLFEISRVGELNTIFQKKGNVRKLRRRFGSLFSRKVLVRDHEQGKYFIFCLEDLTLKEIPMPYSPYFYLERGSRFYIVWVREDEISVGEIKDGELVMKKEWVTSIKPTNGLRIIRVFSSGVTIQNRKEVETYLFEL
jgi:ABC-type transport system involved in multi-copper enzyme maturation permease subunit